MEIVTWSCSGSDWVTTGRIDEARLLASLRSIYGHLQHGSTLELRRRWLFPLPAP
jgi:hypothetical protein